VIHTAKRVSVKVRRVTPSSPVKKISADVAEEVLRWYYATESGMQTEELDYDILTSVAEDLIRLNPVFAGRVKRDFEEEFGEV
jgi:hypothetical protein